MNLSKLLIDYRKGVEDKLRLPLSVRSLAELLKVDNHNLDKWMKREGSLPRDEGDRLRLKVFFGIEEFDNIPEKIVKDAIERYPKGLGEINEENRPEPTPRIYKGVKKMNDNNNLTKKIKYSRPLDNDNSLQLTLSPPREKTIKLLNDDYEINLDSFSATLPTRSDTNGWLPVIADVESLMDLQEAIDKGDKRPNGWPMSAIELVRDPNTKGQYRLQAPPYDNFYPLIRAGKWISVSYVDKYKYKTSVIYLVAFKDKSFMLYYLAQGSTKDKVLLISENTKFGQREYDIEDIHSIYAVSPEI